MRLRTKILLGFLILAGMLLVAGVWSMYSLNSIGLSVQRLLDENYRSITAADRMTQALEREDSGILLLLLGKWEEGHRIIDSAHKSFQEALGEAAGNLTIPGEKEHVGRIEEAYEAYQNLWARPIVDTEREGNIAWYLETVHTKFLETKKAVDDLKKLNEGNLYSTASDLKARAERAVVPGTVATIAALVFSILFSYLVNRFMVGPLTKITEAADDFCNTGRPFDIEVDTDDEIGTLAQAVSRICSPGRGGSR